MSEHGRLDIMYSNAGNRISGQLVEMAILNSENDDFKRVLEVNLYGSFLCASTPKFLKTSTKESLQYLAGGACRRPPLLVLRVTLVVSRRSPLLSLVLQWQIGARESLSRFPSLSFRVSDSLVLSLCS
ncbi:hypothetical protein Ancab_034048 [Ancistrocladus abbreviatus]